MADTQTLPQLDRATVMSLMDEMDVLLPIPAKLLRVAEIKNTTYDKVKEAYYGKNN